MTFPFLPKTKTISIAYQQTQIISKSIGQQQCESTTTSQNIELEDLSPPAPFAIRSVSIHSSSDVGESTAPYRAEPRSREPLDGASDPQVRKYLEPSGDRSPDSTQHTQRTPDFERSRNLEDDHQSTSRNDNDDRSPGVSSSKPGPVDEPSYSINPLSTSSSADAAEAGSGSPTPKHYHRNESFVDTNSLDHQVRVKI